MEELSVNERLRNEGVQELVSDIRHDFVLAIHKYSSKYEFLEFLNEKKIDSYLGMANTYLLKFFQSFLSELPTLFILLLIMIICTYSFLTHSHAIRDFFQKLTGFSSERMEQLVAIFIKDSRQVYMSNIVTGGVQSLLVATGVSLLGIGDFFLVFFLVFSIEFVQVQLAFSNRLHVLAVELGQTGDQPFVDAVSKQQHFDTFLAEDFPVRAVFGGCKAVCGDEINLLLPPIS